MTTLDKAKAAYGSGVDWHARKLMLGACTVAQMIETLQKFQPYLTAAYNCFFVENERGPAVVTCINHQGIRVEYFGGPGVNNYEWLHFTSGSQVRGDADAPRRMMIQPDFF